MRTNLQQRGVSDIVGFILTFSIIVSAVAVVYLVGFDSLASLRDTEQIESGERSMRGVAAAMEDIHRRDAPSRSVTLGLNGGSINLYNSTITLGFENSTGPNPPDREIDVNAFVFNPTDESVEFVYEAGAVFRTRDEAAIARHRPVVMCSREAGLVSVPALRGTISVDASGSVELTGQNRRSTREFPNAEFSEKPTDADAVTIDVSETYNPNAWRKYLERNDGWTQQADRNRFTCGSDSPLERIYVRRTVVDLRVVY